MDLKFLQNLPSWEWPAEAEEMILEVLTDEQAEEANRLVAAELAGDYVVLTDRIVECLVGIVKNADESNLLRATAVVSLGTVLEIG